ncbi:MAG: hypothetical protein TREMPRED_002294 [Tremellales sp. Tagirdzhanova-0007]|nr:MAG: hypothetical protein TREMPRED_002294 [Tremellales sp. Tagirdzhanova-0007]
MRYEQPSIACTVDAKRGVKVYEIPDERTLDAWVDDSFRVLDDATNAFALFPSLEPAHGARLYWLPQSHEIMFRGPHWLVDGVGVIQFWGAFLSLVENVEAEAMSGERGQQIAWGDEPQRLGPTLEALFGYDIEPASTMKEESTDLLNSWLGDLPGVGPPSIAASESPARAGRCAIAEMTFDEATTAKIVAECKGRNISVTAAVEAALILANVEHVDPSLKDQNWIAIHEFNMRPKLPEPYGSPSYALNPYYVPWPVNFPLPMTFDSASTKLHEQYQTLINGVDGDHHREVAVHMSRMVGELGSSPDFLAAPPVSNVIPSSLGLIELHLGREYVDAQWKVDEFHFASDVCGVQVSMYFYTFRDKLLFTYVFNDGQCERRVVEDILETIRQVLMKELML